MMLLRGLSAIVQGACQKHATMQRTSATFVYSRTASEIWVTQRLPHSQKAMGNVPQFPPRHLSVSFISWVFLSSSLSPHVLHCALKGSVDLSCTPLPSTATSSISISIIGGAPATITTNSATVAHAITLGDRLLATL
jgi:hypothetical protein